MTDLTNTLQSPPPPTNQQLILLGLQLLQAGKMNDAERCFRTVKARDPNPTTDFLLATMLPPVYQSIEEMRSWRQRFTDNIRALKEQGITQDLSQQLAVPAFLTTYHGMDDLALHREVTELYRPPPDPELHTRDSGSRIKVGFISSYFREHTIGRLNLGLIQKLSREDFYVSVISLGHHTGELADAYRNHADEFVEITHDTTAARSKIASLGLDILYYTDLAMEPVTYTLAFSRLAPVQCVTWGHPDTTAIPTIDYFLSSEDLDTRDGQKLYSEKLVRLKLPAVCYQRPVLPENPKTRADFGLPDDAHLYGCPQTLYKFHPDFDPILAGILRGDPRGILVLLKGQHQAMDDALMARFKNTMPDVIDRVRFVPRQDRAGFLSLNSLFDVSLDPLHFGGGNTSFESLALGVPMVTLPFDFLRGRITYALYCMMGLISCIVETPEDYIQKALMLGTDRAYRDSVSASILESNSVLFDNTDPVRGLEEFFKSIVLS